MVNAVMLEILRDLCNRGMSDVIDQNWRVRHDVTHKHSPSYDPIIEETSARVKSRALMNETVFLLSVHFHCKRVWREAQDKKDCPKKEEMMRLRQKKERKKRLYNYWPTTETPNHIKVI